MNLVVWIAAGWIVLAVAVGVWADWWAHRYPDPPQPEILPPLDDRTRFMYAVRPGYGLPPVPAPKTNEYPKVYPWQ